MSAYYNEIDPYCVEWLRSLIAAGLIAPGVVDSRPIQEVEPYELGDYTQCHFFAGIGGWSYAARLAGWPDDRPLWTGSCPCQPFSVAGRRKGIEDQRHLWPYFYRLIRASRPAHVMGEQVASAPGYAWLDGVGADLEAEAYTWRAVDIPACSVNAPQIRNRIYWVACAADADERRRGILRPGEGSGADAIWPSGQLAGRGDGAGGVGGAGGPRLPLPEQCGESGAPAGQRGPDTAATESGRGYRAAPGGLEGSDFIVVQGEPSARELPESERCPGLHPGGFWDSWILIGPDPQGKYRRIESGLAPLVAGLPGRVGQIRGYGNAICPPLAAEVIAAYMETADA
jgi:DNA (cytosine-5)-methyltransferase 1